jgi:hypothetical protein
MPIDQKLSFLPRRTIRSSGRPTTRCQMSIASSSSRYTVAQILSASSPYPPSPTDFVIRSQAREIAPSLK